MKKVLTKSTVAIFHINAQGEHIPGLPPSDLHCDPASLQDLRGDCTGLQGFLNGLRGDLTPLTGFITNICGEINCYGKVSPALYGNISGIKGDITGLEGICTGLVGDLDTAEISESEHAHGVGVNNLTIDSL